MARAGNEEGSAFVSLDAGSQRDQTLDTASGVTSARLQVDGETLLLSVHDIVDGVLLSSGLADIAGPCALPLSVTKCLTLACGLGVCVTVWTRASRATACLDPHRVTTRTLLIQSSSVLAWDRCAGQDNLQMLCGARQSTDAVHRPQSAGATHVRTASSVLRPAIRSQ